MNMNITIHNFVYSFTSLCPCIQRLEISRTTGDRRTESCTLCNLGNCLRAMGKLQEAIDHYTLVRDGRTVHAITETTTCIIIIIIILLLLLLLLLLVLLIIIIYE